MAFATIPGTSAEAKIEYVANVLGIAGFVMSLGLVGFSVLFRRGRRRAATLGDIETLGATVARTISEDLVDRLAEPEIAQMNETQGYNHQQVHESSQQLRTNLSRVLEVLSTAGTDDANAAASALLYGETGLAEEFFADRAEVALAEPVQLAKAIEALHLKATLEYLTDPARALKSCARAVELNTDDGEGWRQLGHVHLRLGQTAEAQRAFAQADQANDLAHSRSDFVGYDSNELDSPPRQDN